MKCVYLMVIIVMCSALCTGCTSTSIEYGTFKLHRVSFAQSVDVKVVSTDDGFTVMYGNDGGKETSKQIAAGVSSAVIGSQGL